MMRYALTALFALGWLTIGTVGPVRAQTVEVPADNPAAGTLLPLPATGQGVLGSTAPMNEPVSAAGAQLTPGSSPSDDGSTVLEGQVWLGPTCNIVRPGQCADRPYAATLAVQTADGTSELARVTANDDGMFSLPLDPGTYQVVPLSPEGSVLPFATPQVVSIEPGTHTVIVLRYDSGIR